MGTLDCTMLRVPSTAHFNFLALPTGLAFLVAGMPENWSPVAEIERFRPTDNASLSERHGRWLQAMQQLA